MNRTRLTGIAFAGTILMLAAAAAPTPPLTPQQLFDRLSPSVWRVATVDEDNLPLAQGSAVVIGPQTLVTNCHVLTKARRVSVRHGEERHDARLELWDVQRDLCQIRVPGLQAPAVRLGDSAALTTGQTVFAIGNPKGFDLTMSAGLLSSIRRNDQRQIVLLQTTAAISGGSSGGGLFDDHGDLVGLTTLGSQVGDVQNLNFAIPAEWIVDLPRRHAAANAVPMPALPPAAPATKTGFWPALDGSGSGLVVRRKPERLDLSIPNVRVPEVLALDTAELRVEQAPQPLRR